MKRDWYAVYTKPQREKKVSSILTRRGIENYCPINNIVKVNPHNKKTLSEPLFSCHVFVFVSESEMKTLDNIPDMINFVYWMSKPAVITKEEIDAVKQLTLNYQNIKLEKTFVNMNDMVRIVDEPVISFKENSVMVKYQTLKIMLPSLGYTIIAERARTHEEIISKKFGQLDFLPKRLSSFFSN